MNGLLERLVEVQGEVTKSYCNPDGPEAAKEIERLRELYDLTVNTNEQVEVLRDALIRIKNYTKGNLDQIPYEIAREALKP